MYRFNHKTEIDIVDEIPYKDFYYNYLSKLKPIIIKQGISDMPAINKWSIEYLQNKIGHKKIELKQHHDSKYSWDMPKFFEYLLNDDINAEPQYLTQANIIKLFPELIEDLGDYPVYGLPDWKCNRLMPKDIFYQNYQFELLMGKAGTGFFLHYDRGFINAFVGQVVGKKHVALIPPEDTKYLYPKKDEPAKSQIDIWNIDSLKFPEVAKVRPVFYTLEPGNLVYIPSNWWHSTKNETLSIGITFNSVNRANWKEFSKHIVADHKLVKNPKYSPETIAKVLKIIGAVESIKDKFTGQKPRKGNQEIIWSK